MILCPRCGRPGLRPEGAHERCRFCGFLTHCCHGDTTETGPATSLKAVILEHDQTCDLLEAVFRRHQDHKSWTRPLMAMVAGMLSRLATLKTHALEHGHHITRTPRGPQELTCLQPKQPSSSTG